MQLLNNNSNYRGPSKHVVKHCRALIEQDNWIVLVSHSYREANQVADWLANKGVVQSEDILTFNHPPHALYQLLHADFLGIAWTRRVPS